MSLKISADVSQREISILFQDMPCVLVNIDDMLVITKGSYEIHLKAVHKVRTKLREAGMQLNINESFFAKEQVNYLGYIISRSGITPQPSKVKLIVDMPRPKTVTQVKRFARMINFYRDLWKKRAHQLTPIMDLNQN